MWCVTTCITRTSDCAVMYLACSSALTGLCQVQAGLQAGFHKEWQGLGRQVDESSEIAPTWGPRGPGGGLGAGDGEQACPTCQRQRGGADRRARRAPLPRTGPLASRCQLERAAVRLAVALRPSPHSGHDLIARHPRSSIGIEVCCCCSPSLLSLSLQVLRLFFWFSCICFAFIFT